MELPDQMAAMAAHVDTYAAEMGRRAVVKPPRFALHAEAVKAVVAASRALEAERQASLRRYHRQTLAWQDGPDGTEKEAWIETLQHLINDLDNFPRVAP